ncbi:hypothetical protein MMC09_005347 [Bachmanniomyces sp. S44760]|nr:hypothetical protein [Bachmanniomyces sp. S44760]
MQEPAPVWRNSSRRLETAHFTFHGHSSPTSQISPLRHSFYSSIPYFVMEFSPSRTSSPLPFSISEDLVPVRAAKAAGITEFSFDGALDPPLKIQEDLKEGCGGQVWPAGMVLARFLLERIEEMRGKHVVELGAGGGLVGLSLALALSQDSSPNSTPQPPVFVTDLPILVPLQGTNIVLNFPPSDSHTSPSPPSPSDTALIRSISLPWGSNDFLDLLPPSHRQPDVLLAADCVYFEPAFPLLMNTMRAMIGPKTVCWFCVKRRRKADMGFLKSLKREKQWTVQEVDRRELRIEKGDGIEGRGVYL